MQRQTGWDFRICLISSSACGLGPAMCGFRGYHRSLALDPAQRMSRSPKQARHLGLACQAWSWSPCRIQT